MSEFKLEGNVFGADKVEQWLGEAPKAIHNGVAKWLFAERNKYVGNRKRNKTGVFTRAMLKRQHSTRRGGTWSPSAALMFKGFMKYEINPEAYNLTLKMGLLSKKKSGFVEGMRQMQDGYTRSSSKFMPVPVYQNLQAIGYDRSYYATFKYLMDSDQLVMVRQKGYALYIHKPTIESGGDMYDATMFVGYRRISVKPQKFKFEEKWEKRMPAVMNRGRKTMDRTITRLMKKGY